MNSGHQGSRPQEINSFPMILVLEGQGLRLGSQAGTGLDTMQVI